MKYSLVAERQLIEMRGENMMKTWMERRMQSRERGLRPCLFTPKVGLLDMLLRHRLRAKEAIAIKNGEEIRPTVALLRARLRERVLTNGQARSYLGALDGMLHQMEQDTFPLRTFVACFCRDADGPVLWSRFGQNGHGYMLEFPPDLYVRRDLPVEYSYLTGSVVYKDELKVHQFEGVVDLGVSVLHAIQSEVEHSLIGDHLNLFTSYVASEVAQEIVLMKPAGFEDEREWRFAYSQEGGFPLSVEIAPLNTPHVSLPLAARHAQSNTGLPISGVVLGKYAALTEDEVFELLIGERYDVPRGRVRRSNAEPSDIAAAT